MTIRKAPLGMALFLLSEAVFFVMLILAYVFVHDAGAGPKAGAALDPARTGLFTVALIASSVTLWRADVNRARSAARRQQIWLAATIALGALFLIGQGREYLRLLHAHVTIDASLFATSFFTLTGFHGLHVFAGLVLLILVSAFASPEERTGRDRRADALTSAGLYWHFVDAVWIVIFSVVYLGALR
jgi:heme/copper-type cytochrome/quinol oxidase subunit 3